MTTTRDHALAVAGILHIISPLAAHTAEQTRVKDLRRVAARLRASAEAGTDDATLRKQALEGIDAAESVIHEEMHFLSTGADAPAHARQRGVVPSVRPGEGEMRSEFAQGAPPDELAIAQRRSEQLLATLTNLRVKLAADAVPLVVGASREKRISHDHAHAR